MHGNGARRVCPTCGQNVSHLTEVISHRELRGPRNITSSNIDRYFDDRSVRSLFIEEKQENEEYSNGQWQGIAALARLPSVTVWSVRERLTGITVEEFAPDGTVWPISGAVDLDFDGYQRLIMQWFARGQT